MGVKAGAESEAKRLRRELAREMFADCESELRLEKQAVTKAEARITSLMGRIRRLEAERGELQKNIASINGRAKKAAQASAAKISTLESELSASKSQVRAILEGAAAVRDNPRD